jgi:hypothetical protein
MILSRNYIQRADTYFLEPILGRNYYTVEFVDLFIPVNAWVDLKRVKFECNNDDSWMVRDYVDRFVWKLFITIFNDQW